MSVKSTLKRTLLISLVVRLIPIMILSYFQNIQQGQLSLSDIDYKVYSDSTTYPSPYDRHTYRYSPLLSYMMSWNYTHAEWIGKMVFVGFDLIAIWFLWAIIAKESHKNQSTIKYANVVAKIYGFNPLFVYLTVRGSCESVSMALMYAFWYYFFGNNVSGNLVPQQIQQHKIQQFQTNLLHRVYAYIIYGLWVHFRVYPIIFLPLLLIYEYRNCVHQSWSKFITRFITMAIASGGTFIFLLVAFYSLYGYQFVHETYLYHFGRLDNRHSFSPFFYDIYLSFQSKPVRSLPILCFIFFLTHSISKKYSLYFITFMITFGFVQFNTVITLQYYMWVWGSLLLVLPQSRLLTFNQPTKAFNYAIQWVLGVGLWVWISIKLEQDGDNLINAIWVISIVKILLDLWVLLGFIQTVKVQNTQQLKKLHLQQAKAILLNKKKNK